MRIEAAIVNEQDVDFVVVVVRRGVLQQSASQRNATVTELSAFFDGLPTVLMAQDSRGTPEYYGRKDIVAFLADVPFEALPWAEYTVL